MAVRNGARCGGQAAAAAAAAGAAAATAIAAVARPTASEVTDGDVLSALLERDAVSREQLVQALALCTLNFKEPLQVRVRPSSRRRSNSSRPADR